jgi:hypothetical protein
MYTRMENNDIVLDIVKGLIIIFNHQSKERIKFRGQIFSDVNYIA